MSLAKPDKIRTLQGKLYVKAKAEPEFRFYQLYDKVWREDILAHAYALARENDGAPGVDGVTFDQIEAAGLTEWLSGLREELRQKTYRSQPVRRVMIPKPGGGERPLGIPTIRDRVVQTAVKLVIEPINHRDMPGYFLNDFNRAVDFVNETRAAHVKLQFDVYHRQILHGDVIMALRQMAPVIGHIQIASVPERHEPLTGELDDLRISAEIDAIGYQGYVGCEYRPAAGTREGLGWMSRL